MDGGKIRENKRNINKEMERRESHARALETLCKRNFHRRMRQFQRFSKQCITRVAPGKIEEKIPNRFRISDRFHIQLRRMGVCLSSI